MTYRILSLDGGGSWAVIQAIALGHIYGRDTKGSKILGRFDLVASNSGGGLVLGGLIENYSPAEIESQFRDEAMRRQIFSPTRNFLDAELHRVAGFTPAYSAEAKLPALQQRLPQRGSLQLPLAVKGIRGAGGQDVRVLISAFDYDLNRGVFFRSAEASRPGWGEGAATTASLAEAIHASTNAPIKYFDAPATFPHHTARYWDGGVAGYNNPVLAAVTEALVIGCAPAELAVLSIGTANVALPPLLPGQPPSPYVQAQGPVGLSHDVPKIAASILDDPPQMATFLAYVMTGGGAKADGSGARVIRLNPMISPLRRGDDWVAPPDLGETDFVTLRDMDMDAVAQDQVDLIVKLAELWIDDRVPNQPVRMDGGTLQPEIGKGWFKPAVAEWSRL